MLRAIHGCRQSVRTFTLFVVVHVIQMKTAIYFICGELSRSAFCLLRSS
jgi:hypothetical protein